MKLPIILLVVFVEVFARPKVTQCGYDACPLYDPLALNVHIVAHSHDDVGWLKTVDQYYYGSKTNIQFAGVEHIIDSVVDALKANRERKFVQVESAFLWKWWSQQSESRKADFLRLVNNGQLEIAGGAWSMNDEAAVHYHSVIDQFTFGLKFLNNTLGECGRPKIGWQIDPFGHTREVASIFAQLGYDALFFARLDWRDKGARLRSKTAELLWRSSANLGNDSLLFTHALYNHYSPPPGFYFDVLSQDDPLISDEKSAEYNLKTKVDAFTKFVDEQQSSYATNNVIITMGNDFTYQDARYSYKNLDILIGAFKKYNMKDRQGRRIKLFYSTPACYIKAVNDNATRYETSFKVKTDDYIPYASDYHSYWSGYYSSRPTQKRFERQSNNLLQVAKHLTSFAGRRSSEIDKNLDELRAAVGIMQHHDAITGTEKEHVAKDYAKIVAEAMESSHVNIRDVLPKLLSKNESINLKFESCILANVSHCPESRAKRFVVSVYNPLSRSVSLHVRLPVNSNNFIITGPNNAIVKWQLTPSIQNFSYVDNIAASKFDLVFIAENLPPLGVKLYHIENTAFGKTPKDILPCKTKDSFVLGSQGNIQVQLNPNTGFMHSATLKSGLSLPIKQELMYYIGAQGNNWIFENRSSGAYIFRPDTNESVAMPFSTNILNQTVVYKGDLVDEAHQTFNEWNKQIIRVYKNENHIEFDWIVGPINISDSKSREIISRFTTNLNSERFYTDSNGREILERRNNFRETYNYTNEEPVAGNYYPITSGISLIDKLKAVELAVLNDRAQGGASLNLGELELMVHRRLLKDDAFGVGEALNETEFGKGLVVRGQHFLTFGGNNDNSVHGKTRLKQRDIAQRKLLAPWIFVANASSEETSLENLQKKLNFEFKGLTRELPNEVQILTLEPWRDNQLLLRLEHILEKSEGVESVTVDLKGLFSKFEIIQLVEHTLGANQKLEENVKLKWSAGSYLSGDCNRDKRPSYSKRENLNNLELELTPMKIRTFVATVRYF